MPQVTVYIRTSDIDKWRVIEHKTLFIHNALCGSNEQPVETTLLHESVPITNDSSFCPYKHPIPNGRDRCLGKGCKYS